jgi:hypothetical protein
MQTTLTNTTLTQHSYYTNCVEVSAANFNLLTQQQQTQLTQVEAAFVLEFVANTVASLTAINVEYREDENYFVRLTDALEVLANLQMLYNTLCNNTATYKMTIAQAAQAICAYDTEYRETICEQFEDACNTANFATLALRVICNY